MNDRENNRLVNPSRTLTRAQILLVVGSSVIAASVGFVCLLYHVLCTWLTQDMAPDDLRYALLLMGGNLLYSVSMLVLAGVTGWKPRFYRREVWIGVLLLTPVVVYLNYFLVSSHTPYDLGF